MLLPKGAKTGVVVLFFAWWMEGQRCCSAVAFSSFFCILLFVFGRPPPAPKKYTHVVLCTPSFCWFIYLCCRGRAALCCEKKKFLVLPVAAAAVHPTRGRNPVSCDDSSTLTRSVYMCICRSCPPPSPPSSPQIRDQGPIHLVRVHRVGRQEAGGGTVPVRGEHPRAAGHHRDEHLHAGGNLN